MSINSANMTYIDETAISKIVHNKLEEILNISRTLSHISSKLSSVANIADSAVPAPMPDDTIGSMQLDRLNSIIDELQQTNANLLKYIGDPNK